MEPQTARHLELPKELLMEPQKEPQTARNLELRTGRH
jgi:hypothetical protein